MKIRRRVLLGATGLSLLAAAACESLISKPSLYGTIRADVQRRDSSAIPGAQIVLYTGQRPMGYAQTDSNGVYIFFDVPEGVYGVRAAAPPGYVRIDSIVGGPDRGVRDQLEVKGGKEIKLHFNFLKMGLGDITARVADAAGLPLSGIRVVLYNSAGKVAEGLTNAAGNHLFTALPLGNYGMFAERTIAYLDSAESSLPSIDGFVVDEGSAATASFLFALCTGSIDVRVRDNTGAPVPGTLLTFYGAFGVQDSVLDADSRRQFSNVACGPYGVRIRPPVGWTAAEGRGTTFQDNLNVHRGSALSATLTVTRIGRASVRVRVIDNLDQPVGDVRVVLYTGQGLVRDVLTGPDGFVTMSDLLINNEYGVRVVPRAGYTAPEGVGTTYVDGVKLLANETRDLVFRFKRD